MSLRKVSRPVLSREDYTLQSLERAFPSGEWVETEGLAQSVEPLVVIQDDVGSSPTSLSTTSLTIIGGTKYDHKAMVNLIEKVFEDEIVVGAGRGAEAWLADNGAFQIPANPDVYGKSARKVNVEQVLSYAPTSPLLLVGSGERVKQAEAWLKRANWPREVHRIP